MNDRLDRIPSSILYDVMRGMGQRPRVLNRTIRGIEPTMRCSGPVFTIRGRPDPTLTADESLLAWVECLSAIPGGHVAICQPQDDTRALMGELSADCLRIKGVRGYIVDGGCRDAAGVLAQGFPVFCRYFTPIDIVAAWRFEATAVPIVVDDVVVEPDDYVVATGRTTSVREFCRLAFAHAGLDWEAHVTVDPAFLRPAEVDVLQGDATRARERLGWEPEITLERMVAEMVDADLERHAGLLLGLHHA